MTSKEAVIKLMKPAEMNLDAVCYVFTSFENGILHHCDMCPLKRTSCILYALKNTIYKSEVSE